VPPPDPSSALPFDPATGGFDTTTIADVVPRALLAFDDRGVLRWINNAAAQLCVRSREDLVGRSYRDLVPAKDARRLRRLFLRQRNDQMRMALERCELQLPNGGTSDVGFRAYRVPMGASTGFLIAVDDVQTFNTEVENLRLEISRLNASIAEAEAAAKLKADFLATMSHEIRTPMNGILGMSNLLLETQLDRDQRGFAEIIVSSARSLLQMVDDVLDFSKVEAGKLELETIDFDLRLNVDQVAALLAPRADAKGVIMMCQINHEVPSLVRGDPSRLRQVLLNLAGNALKFTEKGEVRIHVERVEESTSGVSLKFSVTDTGIGMTPEQMAKLFQTYAQVDRTINRKYGGTGLGLAISRQLVTLMGGEIGVSSQAGKGSTFWFKVPLEKQFAVELAVPSRDALRGLRVMVVDPVRSVRESLIEMLRNWDCEVAEAESAHAALISMRAAAAAGRPIAVALLDMHMPGMEGEALGRTIRQERALAGTRLVLLTSLGRRGDAARAKAAGFSAYLLKPVQQLHLHDALVELITAPADATGNAPLVTRHSIEEKRRQRVRILLIEDDVINQLVALSALKRAGYASEVVGSGADALNACERNEYDLIFVDGHLPDMDGMEFAQRLREREPAGKRTPVVAMTAMTADGDREKFLAAGADDYMSKPIDLDVLARMVERWTYPDTGTTMSPATITDSEIVAGTLPGPAAAPAPAESPAPPIEPRATSAPAAAPVFAPPAAAEPLPLLPAPEGVVLDREQLEESCLGHTDLRRTLVRTFMDDIRPRLVKLGTCVAAGDGTAVEFEAHGLKGMCGAIGAVRCSSMFHAIEKAGREGNLAQAPQLMRIVVEEVKRVEGELAPLLAA
jgi:two-component system, sensor histidine kinase and response regulator